MFLFLFLYFLVVYVIVLIGYCFLGGGGALDWGSELGLWALTVREQDIKKKNYATISKYENL